MSSYPAIRILWAGPVTELEAWQWCKRRPGLEIYIGDTFVRLFYPKIAAPNVIIEPRLELAVAKLKLRGV